MLNFNKQNLPFALPENLIKLLSERVQEDGLTCINFRSSDYDAETGGYRPVEIMVEKEGENAKIHYYTEFAYQGDGIYAELGKSNDFDFINRYYSNDFGQEIIGFNDDFCEVFMFFMNTFQFLIDIDAFDEIKLTKIR